MNSISDRRPPTADGGVPRADDVLWQHGAFCGLALPLRATKDIWQREIGATTIRIEPSEGDQVPSGRLLRLALMQICDSAFRTNSPVVDLGESPAAGAAMVGLELDAVDLRDLTTQLDRLLSCRVAVSAAGPELIMFDARGRRRNGDLSWKPSVRLNSRFLASLTETAVPLDRSVVLRLWEMPEALDLYAWTAQGLHASGEQAFTEKWADIQLRFGRGSQSHAAFRLGFDEALQLVLRADESLATAVTDTGVSVRRTSATPADHGVVMTARADEDVQPPADSAAAAISATPLGGQLEDAALHEASIPQPAVRGVAHRPAQDRTDFASSGSLPTTRSTPITQDQVSLLHHLTGLPVAIWLRRGHGEEHIVVGATPGAGFDAERLTVLAVEPMVLQVSGGLQHRDFEQVSAWVMENRDLIDDFWEDRITSFEELRTRVQKLRAPALR